MNHEVKTQVDIVLFLFFCQERIFPEHNKNTLDTPPPPLHISRHGSVSL